MAGADAGPVRERGAAGCSSDKKKGGGDGKKDSDGKKDGKDGDQDDKLEAVKVGGGTISGTIKLKEGVKLPIEELKADLKRRSTRTRTGAPARKRMSRRPGWLTRAATASRTSSSGSCRRRTASSSTPRSWP
jgi:hypothetical protein